MDESSRRSRGRGWLWRSKDGTKQGPHWSGPVGSTSFETVSSLPLDAVNALAVFRFGGDDGEAHLLAHRAAQEAAHTVLLPAGRRHDLRQGDAFGGVQHRHHQVLLASAGFALRFFELSFFGRAGTSSTGAGSTNGGRLWACFQMRLTAVARSLNFRMAVTPGSPFQISTRRLAGQSLVTSASCCSESNAVLPSRVAPVLLMVTIRFSGVMRNRCMRCGSPSRSLRSGHTSLSGALLASPFCGLPTGNWISFFGGRSFASMVRRLSRWRLEPMTS